MKHFQLPTWYFITLMAGVGLLVYFDLHMSAIGALIGTLISLVLRNIDAKKNKDK